jgi:hypothetical protein
LKKDPVLKTTLNLYKKYTKAIHLILNEQEYFPEDITKLREIFITQMNEVLLIALDHHFDPDKFYAFLQGDYKNSKEYFNGVMDYVEERLENNTSYVIINEFLSNMLLILTKQIKDEYIKEVEQKLEKIGINPNTFIESNSQWEELQKSINKDSN